MNTKNNRKLSCLMKQLGALLILTMMLCLLSGCSGEAEAPQATEAQTGAETVSAAHSGVVTVSDVDELIAAIAPNTEIRLTEGTYNLADASSYGGDTGNPYCFWEDCYDGFQLNLVDLENLIILGNGKFMTSLEAESRYANVLYLENCSHVALEGITMGHTPELGECSGGVVRLESCSGVDLVGLGLYGCGVVGLRAENCVDVYLADSDVYDCSSFAVELAGCDGVSLDNCRLYRIGSEEYGGYAFLCAETSKAVTVENCEFSGSKLTGLLNAAGSEVLLRGNLFDGNRVQSDAFAISGQEVFLDGNQFRDNNIRSWYSEYSEPACDAQGEPLTEEKLNELYGEEPAVPSQPRLEVHVSGVDELIAAIGPNTEIVLDAPLYDFSTATGYGTSGGEYYRWEDIYDGPALVICNVDNMTIRSNDGNMTGHTIAAVPRYADVLTFESCSNITLSGFTAGHTMEPGSCTGGVLEFRDSDGILVEQCGLFGCGTLGVDAYYCSDLQVLNCDIYECSEGGIQIWDTTGIDISGCTFRDLGGENIRMNNCSDARIDGEVSIPADTVGTAAVESPEQASVKKMESMLWEFAYAYLTADADTVQTHLASGYAGGKELFPAPEKQCMVGWFEVDYTVLNTVASAGSCRIRIPYREGDVGDFSYMYAVVVREKDAWKIMEYGLEA